MQDLRVACRRLLRDRGFSATAALTLAVCIGANAALFAVVDHVLFRPLPVPESDRLVFVYNSYPNAGAARAGATAPDFVERQRAVPAFEAHALFRTENPSLDAGGTPERIEVMPVTPSFFDLAGVAPQRGGFFSEDADQVGRNREVLLSDGLWQQAFGGRDVLGESVRLDGEPYTIVGIMPPGFSVIDDIDAQAWTPIALSSEALEGRVSNNWAYVARLTPGATLEQAQAQIDALNAANLERFPEWRQVLVDAGFRSIAVPLRDDLVRDVRGTLYLLWGGALFVLLIGAVNVAGLTLVRTWSRLKETAVRLAIGARPWHVLRQLVVEHLLLALVAGLAGLWLGNLALTVFRNASEDLPRGAGIALDGTAVAYTLGASALIGLVLGMLSAITGLGIDLLWVLRQEGRSGTGSRTTRVTHQALVVVQVAAAFVLLVGAGLLFASFRNALAIDPGFDPEGVLTASVSLPDARYGDAAAVRRFTEEALRRVRAVPGVATSGVTSLIPLGDNLNQNVIFPEGFQLTPGESLIAPYQSIVSSGYFEAMRIPLVAGRFLDDRDAADAPRAIVVDEELARRYWPGADPIGRRMYQPQDVDDLGATDEDTVWYTVIGVTGDVRLRSLIEHEDEVGAFYMAQAQVPRGNLVFTVRTEGDPLAVATSIRAAIADADPALPVFDVRTMRDRVDEALSTRRLAVQLSVAFGLVALFLSAIGLYGVLAYQVAQRSREIGVRMALGGSRLTILRLVLREGMLLITAGLAFGALGAAFLTRTVAAELYDVQPTDPVVLAAATALLLGVALAACGLPARRATKVDPVIALAN